MCVMQVWQIVQWQLFEQQLLSSNHLSGMVRNSSNRLMTSLEQIIGPHSPRHTALAMTPDEMVIQPDSKNELRSTNMRSKTKSVQCTHDPIKQQTLQQTLSTL